MNFKNCQGSNTFLPGPPIRILYYYDYVDLLTGVNITPELGVKNVHSKNN